MQILFRNSYRYSPRYRPKSSLQTMRLEIGYVRIPYIYKAMMKMRIMAKLHVIQTTQIHNAPDDLGPEYWFWKQGEAARLYMDSKDNRVHIWSALDYKIPLTDNLVTYVSNTLATHRKSNLDDLGRAIHLLQGFMLYGEHSMPRCKFIITLPDDNIHSDGDKNREQVIAALKAACDKMAEWGYANDAPEEWWLHEEE